MTALTQNEKAERFRTLHQGPRAFVIPNPWDAGSARILAGLGFQALATSSGACAGILGRRDGKVTRDEALAHAPDLLGDRPARGAPISRRASAMRPPTRRRPSAWPPGSGLVGGSIEDATRRQGQAAVRLRAAVERVAAAVEAARALRSRSR